MTVSGRLRIVRTRCGRIKKDTDMAQHLEHLEAALDVQYDRCSRAMRAYESALSTGVRGHDAVAAGRAVYRESVAL
jgi:hypothetical protein